MDGEGVRRSANQIPQEEVRQRPRPPRASRPRRKSVSCSPVRRRHGVTTHDEEATSSTTNIVHSENNDFLESYSTIEVLGAGASGRVERVYNHKLKKEFALKTIPRRSGDQYLETEIVNHSLLRHPHIVQLGEVFASKDQICIQMEYANAGTLFDRVRAEGLLNENEARWYFQQLILALDYCHRRGVFNRDVKLENCVLNKEPGLPQPLLKLCDFGFSKADYRSAPHSKVGTLSAMAPEVMTREPNTYDGRKVDLWSAGVLLYTMISGRRPFDLDHHPQADRMNILDRCLLLEELMLKQKYPTPVCSTACRDLIANLLRPNPSQRFDMAQVLCHPWFLKGLPANALAMNEKYCELSNPNPAEQEALVRKLFSQNS